jgi:hypothetical protein
MHRLGKDLMGCSFHGQDNPANPGVTGGGMRLAPHQV